MLHLPFSPRTAQLCLFMFTYIYPSCEVRLKNVQA